MPTDPSAKNEAIEIRDPASGATARVLPCLGFNCFSWRAPVGDTQPRELLWAEPGFESGDKRHSRSGIPLLFPFPGRIGGARFEFEGQTYELEPGDPHGNAIHGFAANRPWRVIDQQGDCVTAEFRHSQDAADAVGQWPSDYLLTASYQVAGGRLRFTLRAENVGDGPLPFGFGTHAYFRLPLAEVADPEATVVRAPVGEQWTLSEMLPTGETVSGKDSLLVEGAPLAGRGFDTVFTLSSQMAAGQPTGPLVTSLVDSGSGREVRQTFDESMTCCVVYTPDHREAICLEPYTCVPDPFALESRGVAAGLRVLAPGEVYETEITLEAVVA
ncbi:aldose 1-epimerase [Pseudobythopirellula maris]|nr:aldose 1-epimerase [Pseudobythopirellula maris]